MTPNFLKVPKKYRARRNHSASYLGDASTIGAQVQRYLSGCEPEPEYSRVNPIIRGNSKASANADTISPR